jgi:hypothetical protein
MQRNNNSVVELAYVEGRWQPARAGLFHPAVGLAVAGTARSSEYKEDGLTRVKTSGGSISAKPVGSGSVHLTGGGSGSGGSLGPPHSPNHQRRAAGRPHRAPPALPPTHEGEET